MIVNTRPINLSQKTNSLLKKSQFSFVHLPLTKIIKVTPSAKAKQNINIITNFDLLIFTSQSAVIYGVEHCREILLRNKKIPILAIGLATQKSLSQLNLISSIPQTFDSCGLANRIKERGYKKCLVFCGQKNPLLLSLTDAYIDTFACYESQNESRIDLSFTKNEDKLIILIYTQQSLEVLFEELHVNKTQKIILIVASERLKELSAQYGFTDCIVAKSPHDKDMVEAAVAES
mgnify:FL=1